MSDEWGPWIEHDGKGFPLRGGEMVEVRARGIVASCLIAETMVAHPRQMAWYCQYFMMVSRPGYRVPLIVRYRVRRPDALLKLIEMVENLPAPQRERVDA